jgi:hypothetical protein
MLAEDSVARWCQRRCGGAVGAGVVECEYERTASAIRLLCQSGRRIRAFFAECGTSAGLPLTQLGGLPYPKGYLRSFAHG